MTSEGSIRGFGAKLVLFAVPLIILISSLGGLFAWQSYRDAEDQQRTGIATLATTAKASIESFIEARFQLLRAIASDRDFNDPRVAAIKAHLDDVDAAARGFTGGIEWIDTRGRLLAASQAPPGALPVSPSDRAYVQPVLRSGRATVTTIVGRDSGVPLLILAVPTHGRFGGVNGVLAGSVRVDSIGRVAPGLALDGADVRMVDREGFLLLGGGAPSRLVHVDASSPYAQMRATGSGVVGAGTGLTGLPDRLIGYDTLESTGWLVALSKSRAAVLHGARRSLVIELTALLSAALLAIAAVSLGARVIRRSQTQDERRHQSAERLRDVAAHLIAATTVEAVGTTVCGAVRTELGSSWCAIVQPADVDGDPPRLVAETGAVPDGLAQLRFDSDLSPTPSVLDAAAQGALDPERRLPAGTVVVAAAVGSRLDERRIVLAGIEPGRALLEGERGAMSAIVEDAVQAFERAELIERDRRARERTELFARIGAEVDAAEGVDARIQRLLETLVPDFADFATVEAADEGGRIAVLAATHRDPYRLATLLELREHHRTPPSVPIGIAKLLEDGQPQLIERIDEQRFVAVGRATKPLLDELGPGSYLGVPLRSGDRVFAALLLGRLRSSPRFGPDDLAFARSVADRAGVAIDRARLYEQQRHVALELQQNLLSDHPDCFDDQVRVATRYRAAERGLEVGGDWYDAIPLPAGRIGFAVGDVVGHGLAAAAAMGKLASALRAIAVSERDPDEVVRRVEMFAARTDGARLATLLYAILDPRTGVLRYSVAGHPPPLVVSPEGVPAFLWDGRGGPLAVAEPESRPCAETTLPAGSSLLLYSDGLFERRGEIIDDSLARLAEVASRHVGGGPEEMADGVLSDMLSDVRRSDDVVILVASLDHVGRRLARTFPADPAELADLRSAVRAWLADSPVVGRRRAEDALLALGEAASNAVEHAYRDGGAGRIEVDLREDDTALTMTVRDFGHWRDPPAPGPRGRGLDIMHRLVDTLDIHSDGLGTAISMELGLNSRTGVA